MEQLTGDVNKFKYRIPVVLESRTSSQGGLHMPCTLPLDLPLTMTCHSADCNIQPRSYHHM